MPSKTPLEREWVRYYAEKDDGLHWINKRRGNYNWTLFKDGKLVVGVKSKGIVNFRFKAEYDDTKVRVFVKNQLSGLTEVVDSNSKLIATIKSIISSPPLELTIVDIGRYSIEYTGKCNYCFVDEERRRIARTKYDYDVVDASFKVLEWEKGDPNPWLLAIIGLFIGMHRSGTFP